MGRGRWSTDDEDGSKDGPQNAAKRKKGAAFLGGLVLELIKEGQTSATKILLLEFSMVRSLYPSIIQVL